MTLTKRQKFLIPILVLVLVFLVWEVYKTVAGGLFPSVASLPKANAPKDSAKDAISPETNPLVPTPVAFNDDASKAKATTVKLSPDQANYVELVNRFQRLEMEKMIAANSQAIAEAKLKTAEAEAKLQGLSSKYSNSKDNNIGAGLQKTAAFTEQHYELVYTGKFQNQWTATLRKGSELIDINVGNHLDNGASVVAISGEQVILKKGDKEEIIGFNGQTTKRLTDNTVSDNNPSKFLPGHNLASVSPEQVAQVAALSDAIQETVAVKNKTPAAPVPTLETDNIAVVPQFPVSKTPVGNTIGTQPKPVTKNTIKHHKINKQTKKLKAKKPKITEHKSKGHKAKKNRIIKPKVKKAKIKLAQTNIAQKEQVKTQIYSAGEQQILKSNPRLFTVQLIASDSQLAITRFLAQHQHHLGNFTQQFQTKYYGHPWYVLISGQYHTFYDAVHAIDKLPSNMKTFKPFVLPMRSAQTEILAQHIG